MDDLPYIDPVVQAAWISEQTGVDLEDVWTVLAVEFEYMFGVGIIVGPPISFRYYDLAELVGAPRCVDTLRLARDVERITGIPQDTAVDVFDAELRFLQLRDVA